MAVVVRVRTTEAVQDLMSCAIQGYSYKEPMPADEWSGSKADLGVVVGPHETLVSAVWFICIARKGKRWADRYAQGTFSDVKQLDPIPVKRWLAELSPGARSRVEYAIADTGRPIPPGTWQEARAALVRLRPDAAGALHELEQLLQRTSLPGPRARLLAEQKDAIGLALSIAGFDRAALSAWEAPSDDHAPWLAGLRTGRIREDVMVVHDASRAEGWWPTDEPYVGIKEFANRRGERLTVMNANRHEVEEIAGVDLLYYRHEPASFVLVQYKRASARQEAMGGERYVFYPSTDSRFADELARMRAVDLEADECATAPTPPEYRLHPRACWIKLCDPRGFVPHDAELVKGMYLPLDYYESLLASPLTRGPRGGIVLDHERVRRWINNTLFISLMSGGWVGSRGIQTELLARTVRSALEGGRSFVIAREERWRH